LDLAGAADGFVDDADAAQRWRGIERGAVDWEIVEVQVLGDVVDGNIEAGSVSEIEDFEGVLHGDALGDLGHFDDGEVGAALPGLAENVALAGGVSGFEGVASGDGAAEIAGIEKRDRKAIGIEGWLAGICSAGAGIGIGGRAARGQGDDRIGDAVAGAVVDAANRAGVVDDAIGLAALDDGQTCDGPAVGEAAAP